VWTCWCLPTGGGRKGEVVGLPWPTMLCYKLFGFESGWNFVGKERPNSSCAVYESGLCTCTSLLGLDWV
jgi:hypothetical protein